MSDADTTSEDEDYEPNNAEVQEAEADAKRKRKWETSEKDSAVRKLRATKANPKVDEVWRLLRGANRSAVTGNLNVVSLCNRSGKHSASMADREWMQQLGVSSYTPSSRSGQPLQRVIQQPPQLKATGTGDSRDRQMEIDVKAPNFDAAENALAAVTAASGNGLQQGEIITTETRRFAGKNVQVNKVTSVEEAEKLKAKEEKKSGIDSLLASLQAAKKVNVLDKSRDDWGQYKKTDAQVEEELEAYKKSGGKYLDKVDFLKRTELREYEAERDQKLAGDIRNRGRS